MRSEKNHFSVLFYSAKPNSDHVTISNFSSFFRILTFYCFDPYNAQMRKMNSAKITFECSLTVQKPFQTILGIPFFSKLLKKLNFSQNASHGKCVEYAKLNATRNQRKICKIYAKFNSKYVRSTLYKNCGS